MYPLNKSEVGVCAGGFVAWIHPNFQFLRGYI